MDTLPIVRPHEEMTPLGRAVAARYGTGSREVAEARAAAFRGMQVEPGERVPTPRGLGRVLGRDGDRVRVRLHGGAVETFPLAVLQESFEGAIKDGLEQATAEYARAIEPFVPTLEQVKAHGRATAGGFMAVDRCGSGRLVLVRADAPRAPERPR